MSQYKDFFLLLFCCIECTDLDTEMHKSGALTETSSSVHATGAVCTTMDAPTGHVGSSQGIE